MISDINYVAPSKGVSESDVALFNTSRETHRYEGEGFYKVYFPQESFWIKRTQDVSKAFLLEDDKSFWTVNDYANNDKSLGHYHFIPEDSFILQSIIPCNKDSSQRSEDILEFTSKWFLNFFLSKGLNMSSFMDVTPLLLTYNVNGSKKWLFTAHGAITSNFVWIQVNIPLSFGEHENLMDEDDKARGCCGLKDVIPDFNKEEVAQALLQDFNSFINS